MRYKRYTLECASCHEVAIANTKEDVEQVTFSVTYESPKKRRRPKGETEGDRETAGRVIAAPLRGQIKFKRMTRTLVSRAEQWPFEHTPLEDLSRRLLTLRCTVDGTMENCAAAAK